MLLFYPPFKSETSANIPECERQDSVDQEIKTEINFFSAEEDLSAEEVKEFEVLSW